MKQTFKLSWVLIALFALTVVSSCKKDDDDPKPEIIASFDFEQDQTNQLQVTFTNNSQNATSYEWDFGDGSSSTEKDPVHVYESYGQYTVKLTAKGDGNPDVSTKTITLANSNALLQVLAGDSQKEWRLIRDISTLRYPLEVGQDDPWGIWWYFGQADAPLASRPCMLNDTWTFKTNGEVVYDDGGDYWAEGSVYPEGANNTCASSATMVNKDGVDVSAWGSGTHQWEMADGKLKLVGNGAFLGLSKIATSSEVAVPQPDVEYSIIKLEEGTTADTLIVQTSYLADGVTPAHWRIVLVHYPNPADEPELPQPKPAVGFTYVIDGGTVTFTNTTDELGLATTYAWDFGDGGTSAEKNPVYTYAADGLYDVKLTATNANGFTETLQSIFYSTQTATAELISGAPWKIRLAEKTVFVGETIGASNWWSVPLADMQPGGAWACMMNDEFIFNTDGTYEYRTNGDARNDGYKGQAGGCYSDAELSALDFPFLSATHTYTVETGASGRANIVLTNGPSQAAFIGFYKGYYGGENNDQATAPNGGNLTNRYEVMGYVDMGDKEYLFVSVDLNGDAEGGASWSAILER